MSGMLHAQGKVLCCSPCSVPPAHGNIPGPDGSPIDATPEEPMTNTPPSTSVTARLTAMAARRSGLDVASIELGTPLADLGIDSLGLAEFMFDIDDEFKIEISDEQMVKLNTVGDLVAQIELELKSRANP
jgi:acyl carrier protein